MKRAFDEWQNEADGDRMKFSSNEDMKNREEIGKYNKGWWLYINIAIVKVIVMRINN